MKPTDILMHEHRIIEQVLNCLERIVENCKAENKLNPELAREAIYFFRGFADRCHHGKEEAQLFPLMKTRGFGGGCGPIAVMLREHELGRIYVGGMEERIESASLGEEEGVRWFIENAQSYMRLLREHIQKEDHCLFPAADRALNEEDQQILMEAFEKVENEEIGKETHEEYVAIANRLAAKCYHGQKSSS